MDYFSGYSATITSSAIVSYISSLPEIRAIEQDQVVRISACVTQPVSSGLWGLSRISYRTITPNGVYSYNDQGGAGVDAYVIDTGILTTHNDFGGRASLGRNFITSETGQDLNGHGTHCAGTIGGNTYGVAKKSTLIAVKVLDRNGSGALATVIDGVNWVASQRRARPSRPCAVNLSLGSSYSATVNNAVDALVDTGCFTAVAAGNSNRDACTFSPASAPKAYCVAASDSSDIRASFSNFGTCAKTFAPGVNILSTYIGSNSATASLSGTSMASPHVCGVATAYLGVSPNSSPAAVGAFLTDRSTKNQISDSTNTPNRLLYSHCL